MHNNKFVFIIAGFLLITAFPICYYFHSKPPKVSYSQEYEPINFAKSPIESRTFLNDKNDIHLFYAQKNGIKKSFETDSAFNMQVGDLVRKALLVKVTDNKFYKLKKLSQSQPYLIPEAVDMLNDIGFRFHELLKKKKYTNYRFMITSLLRTEKAQNQLTHRNSNATIHSSHLYGTTVDISYKNFYNMKTDSLESSYEAVQTLTTVLQEMRKECKLLVVRERKQSCFHITVIVCRPLD